MLAHRLLVIDNDVDDLGSTKKFLERRGFLVETAQSGADGLAMVGRDSHRYSAIIVDYDMPEMNGAEVTRKLKSINPDLYILIFSGVPDRDAFLLPLRQGACAFVGKREGADVFLSELGKLIEKYEAERVLVSDIRTDEEASKIISSIGMVGRSKALARAVEKVWRLRTKSGPVLLLGESGVGKEQIAKALHHTRTGRFVAKNCADFGGSQDLARSQLFGYAKGAFTNAIKDTAGVFEEAHGGTVFLDELPELDMEIQASLLRALQEMIVNPLGPYREIQIDCRFVSAAKPDLLECVDRKEFKPDLFYRISENIIKIPTLSERPEDIAPLTEHFCKLWSIEAGKTGTLRAGAIALLESRPWPGNVRELNNVVFATLNKTEGKAATRKNVEETLDERSASAEKKRKVAGGPLRAQVEAMKKSSILEVLSKSTSLRDAARKLEVAPSTVLRYLRRRGIDPKQFLGTERLPGGLKLS